MGTSCHRCRKTEGIIMYRMDCGHHNCTECIEKTVDMSLPIILYKCKCSRKILIGKDYKPISHPPILSKILMESEIK